MPRMNPNIFESYTTHAAAVVINEWLVFIAYRLSEEVERSRSAVRNIQNSRRIFFLIAGHAKQSKYISEMNKNLLIRIHRSFVCWETSRGVPKIKREARPKIASTVMKR